MTKGELERTCILTGGDPFSPAAPVEPGALSVLKSVPPISIDRSSMDGKRTALAEWIANPMNVLTTRVIVNRIWMWHFQKTHRRKSEQLRIDRKTPNTSNVARLASRYLCKRRLVDQSFASPNHELAGVLPQFAASKSRCTHRKRPQRYELRNFCITSAFAEEMRDAMLCITGELNDELGGIPNRPEINSEVALQPRQIMGSFAAAWVPNPLPKQRHRRSIYSLKLRGLADPMMQVFNSPARDFSCEMRSTSTVTPQAFSLFNGKATHARALAFAKRMLDNSNDDEDAIRQAFLHAYARTPTQQEIRDCLTHWQQIERDLGELDLPAPKSPPHEVVRDAIEENTGEPFPMRNDSTQMTTS